MRSHLQAVLAAVIVATGTTAVWAQDQLPFYVGREVCLACHAQGVASRACSLEPISAHGRSYEALSRSEAGHIAAISGLPEEPQQSRICLGCHATAADDGPRWTEATFKMKDGVQCEACHGAGSLHAEAFRQTEEGNQVGMSRRLRIPDRTMCTACHREKESHRQILKLGYRQPPTDRRYKTPVNLVVSPDSKRLFVVCSNSDSLIIVDTDSRAVVSEVSVGHRPHDVAVSPDGQFLFVTNRLGNSVSVINTESAVVVGDVAVGAEPHGVIFDGPGKFVYVMNTAEDSISVLDAKTRREVKRLVAGRGPWSAVLQPKGQQVLVTNVRPDLGPFREPPRSEITVIDAASGNVGRRVVIDEANMLQGAAVVPGRGVTLFTLLRTKNLVPMTRLTQGWTVTNGLGVLWPDGRVAQVLLDRPNESFPDPTDVAVSPDGRYALVSSGGADQVAVVDVGKLLSTIAAASPRDRRMVLPNHLGLSYRYVVKHLNVGRNPRGVAFSPDGQCAYVANALDDTVTIIDTAEFTIAGHIALGGPTRITETRLGERLFHSAGKTFGRQFSCRTCHPDGHINGLTFDIEPDGLGMEPVDNRTLRGIIDTAPFKWAGTNPTLRRQCGPRLAVFFTRVDPVTPVELTALVRYIRTIERPPNRHRRPDGLTPAQRRGKFVFERTTTNSDAPIPPERRCVTCHNSPYKTERNTADVGTTMWFDAPIDLDIVDVRDLAQDIEAYGELGLYYFKDTGTPTRSFDAPHLTNIYDSAPYLHNGAAPTLEAIWTRFDVLMQHGQTNDLTRGQFNDLIAYLKAL